MIKKFNPLLANRPFPNVENTKPFNLINGFDAEILAASRILTACGGEIKWSSRTEEGNKIDLILSYEHPWYINERLIMMVQVKSGESYGHIEKNGFVLKSAAKKLSQRTSKGICVIWVNRDISETFWAYVHPRTIKGQQEYGGQHKITPSLRYDLARCEGNHFNSLREGSGVTLKFKGSTIKERRDLARTAYKNLKTSNCFSPALGNIDITRVGWRHMFRSDRSSKGKVSSCAIIPHLKNILLHKPSEIFAIEPTYITHGEYTIRCLEYVLSFVKCKFFDKTKGEPVPSKVLIRCIEEIKYPTNWINQGIISQKIERTVTFLSCHFK